MTLFQELKRSNQNQEDKEVMKNHKKLSVIKEMVDYHNSILHKYEYHLKVLACSLNHLCDIKFNSDN